MHSEPQLEGYSTLLEYLTFESRPNLDKELPLLAALKPREAQLPSTSWRKREITSEYGRKRAGRSLR